MDDGSDIIQAEPWFPKPEHPNEAQLRGYGDIMFLALRESRLEDWPLKMVRRIVQPPVDLLQFRVFRLEGVPRSAFTWASLGREAERKIVRQELLAPQDWRSGTTLWIMDFYAPYAQGTAADMVRWLKAYLPETVDRVRYARAATNDRPAKYLEVQRMSGARWGTRSLSSRDLLSED